MSSMKLKKQLRKSIDKGARMRQYFLRGHSGWFSLFLSLINFTLIFYNLLFKNLFFIPEELKHYSIFFIVFGACYFPIASLFGWFDFRKGTYKAEQALTKEISPIWHEVFMRLENIQKSNESLLKEFQKES